jgi:hypothetical protein
MLKIFILQMIYSNLESRMMKISYLFLDTWSQSKGKQVGFAFFQVKDEEEGVVVQKLAR